jgi:hypothetical protein
MKIDRCDDCADLAAVVLDITDHGITARFCGPCATSRLLVTVYLDRDLPLPVG